MRIENFVSLIGGELINAPVVREIDGFEIESEKVKRKNLFFAIDKNKIKEALQNGAYGIVFEENVEIRDKEIAWIRVVSIEKCLVKLLRFFIMQQSISVFNLSKIEFEIFSVLNKDERVQLLEKRNLFSVFKRVENKKCKAVVVKDNFLRLKDEIIPVLYPLEVVKKSIFEESFIFKEMFVKDFFFSPIFNKELEKVLNFFESEGFVYSFTNISEFSFFKPFFVDYFYRIVDFGSTSKAIIVEKEYSLAKREREFLLRNAKWANKIFISDKSIEGFVFAEKIEKIKKLLYNLNYNYAMVVSKNFDIEKIRKEGESSLFKGAF